MIGPDFPPGRFDRRSAWRPYDVSPDARWLLILGRRECPSTDANVRAAEPTCRRHPEGLGGGRWVINSINCSMRTSEAPSRAGSLWWPWRPYVALGSTSLSAQPPSSEVGRVHLNHVNLRVASVQRAIDFYQHFFGLAMKPTATYHALDCGNGTFISLQTKADIDQETFRVSPDAVEWARTPDATAGMIEHFCLEIDNFDLQKTREALKAAGHEAVVVGDNLLTSDPDGILVQVVDTKLRFPHEG